jgi:hypothetical protein
MTYGFRPENWPAFQAQLQERGIAVTDIERVEIRPETTHTLDWREPLGRFQWVSVGLIHVTVTLRSGRVESWRQPQAEGYEIDREKFA